MWTCLWGSGQLPTPVKPISWPGIYGNPYEHFKPKLAQVSQLVVVSLAYAVEANTLLPELCSRCLPLPGFKHIDTNLWQQHLPLHSHLKWTPHSMLNVIHSVLNLRYIWRCAFGCRHWSSEEMLPWHLRPTANSLHRNSMTKVSRQMTISGKSWKPKSCWMWGRSSSSGSWHSF